MMWQTDKQDAADLMGVPAVNAKGRAASAAWREAGAALVVELVGKMRTGTPKALALAELEDALSAANRHNRLVNVDIETAQAFIREHHSALPTMNPRGLMYAIGITHGNKLVAVATAGTPTGRWKDPHSVLELTRVASDGSTKGASSMLVARLIDLVNHSPRGEGPAKLITYQLMSEAGTTYRALRDKGLRPVAKTRTRGKGTGARSGSHGDVLLQGKIRWEAGPGAGEANWNLLEDH